MSLTGLLFLVAFFAGLGLAIARHPIYGLVTYVAVFYLHPPSRWWGETLPDLRWSLLSAAVTAIAVLMARSKQRKPVFGAKAKPKPARTAQSVRIPKLFDHAFATGVIFFLVWICLQSFWALDGSLHGEFVGLWFKYLLLVALMYACVENELHLRMFLWAHVLGCFYLGWLAYSSNEGGRFEYFGGPGIGEANAGALQMVTGILAASALFLAGKWRERLALFAVLPFIVNALVTTVSRSGFLALLASGVVFNLFTPKVVRKQVTVLSVLAAVMFAILTGPAYWTRMQTIKTGGEEAGEDTSGGRLVIMEAQWRMFQAYPLGCGHRCTAVLSAQYLDDRYLTGTGESRARSSHNTFMSLLVEQGVPGALMYVLLFVWLARSVVRIAPFYRSRTGFLSRLFPAVAGVLIAITIGDFFVDYVKSEVRIWFIAILLIMVRMAAEQRSVEADAPQEAPAPAGSEGLPSRSSAGRMTSK